MADKKLRPSSQADLRHKLRKNLGINQSFYVVFRFTDEWVGITVVMSAWKDMGYGLTLGYRLCIKLEIVRFFSNKLWIITNDPHFWSKEKNQTSFTAQKARSSDTLPQRE